MRRGIPIARLVALAVVALTPHAPAGRAQEAQPAPAPEAIVLFDGKSLEGWKNSDFYKPGEVAVEDGAIVIRRGRPMSGITTTRADLPTYDYELSYEAKRLEGEDFFAAATFPVGDAHATLVNGGWGGSVTGISSLDGADASENGTSAFVKYENGRWYRFRVRVAGGHIRCWVDDKEVVDADIRGRKVSTRIEVRASRPLGFATWESAGAVRAIRIQKLPPVPIPPIEDEDR